MAMNLEQLYERLTPEEITILKQQIERFKKSSEVPRKDIEIGSEIILPEGTLSHGTPADKKTLSSIAKTGIITGQAFGIEEDGETFYCADFHRTNSEQTLKTYNENFRYTDGRCPFGRRGKFTIAFLLYPDKDLDELIAYDCYKNGTQESDITKTFVNMDGLPLDDETIVSSVLFGVPSNFINGIIVGDNSINEEMIPFLIEEFPGTFISRNNGEIIYKKGDDLELVSARIKSINRLIALEKAEEELEKSNEKIGMKQAESDKLWSAIATLPVEHIAQIYQNIGHQGDCMIFAERLKEQHQESSGKKM